MTTDSIPPNDTMSESAAWAMLRTTVVGRLAVTADSGPDIFPVNYVVDGGTVVFRTAAGTKLARTVRHRVAFETDGYDPGTGEAWSVVLKGVAREVIELSEVVDALELPLNPWHATSKPYIVRIEPDSITGRRFAARTVGTPTQARRSAPE